MKLLCMPLLACLTITAYAQFSEVEFNKNDSLKTSYLEELVISANKIPEQRRTVAQQVRIISPATIKTLNAQTTADLLQNTGVVAMQRSQQGGGSPILRGFEASRVLLVVDGVRLNNAIYRAGHLQNVITMDNNILDRAEVLLGPSSTVYGSDALGGVVHFYSRNPLLATDTPMLFTGNAFARYGSANEEKTTHFDIDIAGKRFGLLTSFTYSDFGDLRMGKRKNKALGEEYWLRNIYAVRSMDNLTDEVVVNTDPYRQVNSGYQQYDFLQKFLFKQSQTVQHIVNFQYSTSSNIPRYDRLTDINMASSQPNALRFGQWYYGPQKRVLISYQLQLKNLGRLADALTTTASYQAIEESRHDRRFNNVNLNHRTEKIDVLALTIDFQKHIRGHKLRYGFDGQFNRLTSTAFRENIITGATSSLDTRYPDGTNTLHYWALYATHTYELNDKWILNDGVRVGGSSLHSTFQDKTFFQFPFDAIQQRNVYGSGNLGIIYTPSSWKLSLMGSTGYRVPNIDDLAKVFETVAGSSGRNGTLVVPNPELKPEKTINADFSATKFFSDRVRLEGVVYATNFFDAIVTRPSTFNGQAAVIYNGFPANVVSSQNAASAYIYGYSMNARAEITREWVLTGSYNYTHGRVRNDNGPETPLDHIPPAFGRVGMGYNRSKLKTELFSQFNGWKRLRNYSASGEDNLQYATPNGMPSWYTINARISYDLSKNVLLQAGVDNLLDLQYRQFASGINAPGRNIFGTLRIKF